MPSIILVHPAGPDRDALAGFLAHSVATVLPVDDAASVRSETITESSLSAPLVFLVHEDCAEAVGKAGFRGDHPLYVIGKTRSLSDRSIIARFGVPYFPGDILTGIQESLRPAEHEIALQSSPHGNILPDTATAELLRALAHGLKNPLAGADGWMQLLAQSGTQQETASRPLKQVRAELQRLGTMLHALALLGTPPAEAVARANIATLLHARRQETEKEDFPITWHIPAHCPSVYAEGSVLDTALKLLWGSFLDDRARARDVEVRLVTSRTAVAFVLSERGDNLRPFLRPAASLAALLHDARPARALAWALLVKCAQDGGGALAVSLQGDRAALQLTLRAAQECAESAE